MIMKITDPDLLAAWDASEMQPADHNEVREHAFVAGWNATMASVREWREFEAKILDEERREEARWK